MVWPIDIRIIASVAKEVWVHIKLRPFVPKVVRTVQSVQVVESVQMTPLTQSARPALAVCIALAVAAEQTARLVPNIQSVKVVQMMRPKQFTESRVPISTWPHVSLFRKQAG